jgi:hypothetical protein
MKGILTLLFLIGASLGLIFLSAWIVFLASVIATTL